MNSFRFRSKFKEPVEEVFDWHMRSGTLERLIPPWDKTKVIYSSGAPSEKGEVHLRMRKCGVSFDMKIGHTDFVRNRLFQDEQKSGPFRYWRHIHRFERSSDGGSVMEDHIEWAAPFGSFGDSICRRLVTSELRRLFTFRHQRLKDELERIRINRSPQPLSIAITGSNGLIGASLCHVLTTMGHTVIPLVRNKESIQSSQAFWDPTTGEIDRSKLENIDAVIHLAGEPLLGFRWTEKKKEAIQQSRIVGTEGLAKCLVRLEKPPKVFVSASAVGFYGDRGLEDLTEQAGPGRGFLADLCQAWEGATQPAVDRGIRVVHPRMGIVLTPAGGALSHMLPAFRFSVGARFGKGNRFMSWIDHDDLLSLIVYCVVNEDIEGPVNAVSPNPVSNATFSNLLGEALNRPVVFSVPDQATKMMLGELGTEMFLASTKVVPEVMTKHGFNFKYAALRDSLSFQLGRCQ